MLKIVRAGFRIQLSNCMQLLSVKICKTIVVHHWETKIASITASWDLPDSALMPARCCCSQEWSVCQTLLFTVLGLQKIRQVLLSTSVSFAFHFRISLEKCRQKITHINKSCDIGVYKMLEAMKLIQLQITERPEFLKVCFRFKVLNFFLI